MTLNPGTTAVQHISLFCLLLISPLHFTQAQPAHARNEVSSANQNADLAPASAANAPEGVANAPVKGSPLEGPNSVGGASNQAVNKPEPVKPSQDVEEITYDQRQNGTQNVRIHLDDVTLLVAPSDSLVGLFSTQQVVAALAGQNAFAPNSSLLAQAAQSQNYEEQAADNNAGEDTSDDKKPTVGGGVEDGPAQELAPSAADPYADFNELLSAANFLKKAAAVQKGQHHQQHQQGVAGHPAGAKRKVCTGPRCTAKRNKLNLTRYLLPIFANYQQHQHQQQQDVNNPSAPIHNTV